jgi:hypothetical protein
MGMSALRLQPMQVLTMGVDKMKEVMVHRAGERVNKTSQGQGVNYDLPHA